MTSNDKTFTLASLVSEYNEVKDNETYTAAAAVIRRIFALGGVRLGADEVSLNFATTPGAQEAMFKEALAAARATIEAEHKAKQSRGHICFVGAHELYEFGGNVYAAKLDNIFDVEFDVRLGRWVGSRAHYERHKATILEGFSLQGFASAA